MLIHDRRPKLSNSGDVVTIPICTLTDANTPATTDAAKFQCDPAIIDPDRDMAWIPHSSGSTGIPKLFKSTQAHAMREMHMLRNVMFHDKSTWVASAVYVSPSRLSLERRVLPPSGKSMKFDPQTISGSRKDPKSLAIANVYRTRQV